MTTPEQIIPAMALQKEERAYTHDYLNCVLESTL